MKLIKGVLSCILLILLNPILGFAGNSEIQISLLTCSPGQDLYAIYGHNGIRIQNKTAGTDIVYNYGTFDFQEKGFILKFMRGKLPYTISAATYDRFLYEYNYFQRSVREQVLQLDSLEKQKIIQFIDWNMLPENKTYKYDFFKDNCATRIRNVLDKHISGIQWNTSLASGKTFREIIKEYQKGMPWTNFGIDLIIGAPADNVTSLSEETFIPDYLAKAVSHAKNGDFSNSLQVSEIDVLTFEKPLDKFNFLLSPWFLFSVLLLLEIFIFYRFLAGQLMRWVKYFDRIWIGVVVLSVMLMAFMWFGTDHIPTKYNYNLLWCSPLLPIFYFLKSRETKYWILKWLLFFFLGISALNAVDGMMFLPQYFHPLVALISIIFALKVYRWDQNVVNLY